jgi:cytoskeletal protein CcmA (bactofilin family)
MQAIFEYVAGGGGTTSSASVFSNGITGCSGVAISGSGLIDSYDSSLGDYNDTLADGNKNTSEESFVNTVNDSGDITLNGSGTIEGNVLSSSNLSIIQGADITGNIHSNGNLILSGGVVVGGDASAYLSFTQSSGTVSGSISANQSISVKQTPVGGDISSSGPISITGNTIQGTVRSYDLVALNQTSIRNGVYTSGNYEQTGGNVYGGVRVQGNVTLKQWGSTIDSKNLRYAGNGSFKGDTPEYAFSPYKVSSSVISIPDIEPVEKITPESENNRGLTACDPLDIATAIDSVSVNTTSPDLFINNNSSAGDLLELETNEANFLVDFGSTPDGDINAQAATFLDSATQIFYFDDVTIKGRMQVKSNHNAVMFVDGDFTMNGASSLTIPDNSSLTIIIKGKLKIGNGAQVYAPDNGITNEGRPVFSIYSSYSGNDTGIEFSGGTRELYAVIYAPLSQVKVTSAVGFKGSILGDTVIVSGAGGIHFDTALNEASFGGSSSGGNGSASKLVFKGWRFTPVEQSNEQQSY